MNVSINECIFVYVGTVIGWRTFQGHFLLHGNSDRLLASINTVITVN